MYPMCFLILKQALMDSKQEHSDREEGCSAAKRVCDNSRRVVTNTYIKSLPKNLKNDFLESPVSNQEASTSAVSSSDAAINIIEDLITDDEDVNQDEEGEGLDWAPPTANVSSYQKGRGCVSRRGKKKSQTSKVTKVKGKASAKQGKGGGRGRKKDASSGQQQQQSAMMSNFLQRPQAAGVTSIALSDESDVCEIADPKDKNIDSIVPYEKFVAEQSSSKIQYSLFLPPPFTTFACPLIKTAISSFNYKTAANTSSNDAEMDQSSQDLFSQGH